VAAAPRRATSASVIGSRIVLCHSSGLDPLDRWFDRSGRVVRTPRVVRLDRESLGPPMIASSGAARDRFFFYRQDVDTTRSHAPSLADGSLNPRSSRLIAARVRVFSVASPRAPARRRQNRPARTAVDRRRRRTRSASFARTRAGRTRREARRGDGRRDPGAEGKTWEPRRIARGLFSSARRALELGFPEAVARGEARCRRRSSSPAGTA